MKRWVSLQAELGDFHHRRTIYIFALKMSFLAVILSALVILLMLPVLHFLGLLPLPFTEAIRFGIILSWPIGFGVSGVLAVLAGYAIHELSVSRAEFERLSRTDMLSGLVNRRAFTEMLERTEDGASLAIFDVDRFKTINDRYGHASGDAVIVAVSQMLSSAFDGASLVARLGGEEFGAVICGGNVEDRIARVEGVKALISSEAIAVEGGEVRITISAGIADIWRGCKKEAVYAAADKALYLAKALGRNRIVHESEGLHHAWQRRRVEDETDPQDDASDDDTQYGYGI